MERQQMDIEGFTEWLRNDERSENTIKSYAHAVKEFFKAYTELDKKSMIAYKQMMMKDYSPATADIRCIAMNRYCHYIGKQECCVKTIKRPKNISTETVITLDEYKNLLGCLKNDGNMQGYWMVVYMAKTGCRVSELVQMKKDILKKGYMEIWTKGRIRRIYVPSKVIEDSHDFLMASKSDYVFPNRYGNQITREGIRERLQRYAKKYKIRKEAMHPHSFRHLFAIQFLENDKDISLLADLMGHAEISTTARYTQLTQEQQIKRLNKQSEKW